MANKTRTLLVMAPWYRVGHGYSGEGQNERGLSDGTWSKPGAWSVRNANVERNT